MTVTIDQNKRQEASKTVKEDLGQDHVGGVGEGEAKGEEGEAEKVALSETEKHYGSEQPTHFRDFVVGK